MNNKVEVTGMTVQTKVSNNLLISPDEDEAHYKIALHSALPKTLLEPVSTVNGTGDSFYYTSTTNVDGDGDALNEAYTLYTAAGADNFDKNYGVDNTTSSADASPYIDYSFYIKATNADDAARKVYFTKVNLLYDGAAITSGTAWRAAIFAKPIGTSSQATSDEVATTYLKSILGLSTAKYFSELVSASSYLAVNATATAPSTAVSNYKTAAVIDDNLAAHTTRYYKVTVRLWLEGEDTSCKNDVYAELKNDWNLDLEIVLGENTAAPTAVTVIGTTANATTTNGTTATVTLAGTGNDELANGEKAVSFAWVNLDGTAPTGTGANTASFTTGESTSGTYSYYCNITTDKGNVYRTNSVILTVT